MNTAPARRAAPAILLLVLAALALPACNTVKGIGQDIQAGAEKTQEWISGDQSASRQSKAEPKN